MFKRLVLHPVVARVASLGAVLVVAAVVADATHRHGHTQGDDFALYLRQARSLFDGDVGAVIADNRFSVLNSDNSFSPVAYPWGWPILLAPFVHLWGLDYDRLKIVVVVTYCAFLLLFHGIVRRRLGRVMALGVVAVLATAPPFLTHTDELISEFPHLLAIGVFVWWYDRIRRGSTLHRAALRDLIVLGVLATVVFNVRREGIVLVGVIAVMQTAELLSVALAARGEGIRSMVTALVRTVRTSWRAILVPYGAFVVSAAAFQLLLPSTLLPDNDNSRKYIDNRFGDYPRVLTGQLGLGEHAVVGVMIIAVALIGVVVGVRRRPSLDGPIALIGAFSALTISTHFRLIDRYWLQITPWVVYFVAVASLEAVRIVVRHRLRVARIIALAPLLYLIVVHAAVLPGVVDRAGDFNAAGRYQFGPGSPAVTPIFDAVRDKTPPTAVIAFYRARTMTLATDRLSIQTTSIDKILLRADYFAQRRNSHYWQPDLTSAEARDMGLEEVWSDSRWILWKVTPS
jgi:hypothetical protein